MIREILFATCTMASALAVAAPNETVPVIDMHSDVLYRMMERNFDLVEAPEYMSTSIPLMEQGGMKAQVFALWVHDTRNPGMEGAKKTFEMIDLYYEQQEKHSDRIAIATTMAEADRIHESGKTAIFLFIEGGNPISDDITMLRTYHRLGVRGMTLTWMNNLLWAGAATEEGEPGQGLTEFGREVVQEMNRLNMVVDLSHVSDETFYDAIEVSKDPVVASHSGVRALFDHKRNISDAMLKALSKNGGVIGIVAFPGYLSDQWDEISEAAEEKIAEQLEELKVAYDGEVRNPEYRYKRKVLISEAIPEEKRIGLDVYIDHISHAIDVAGIDHVALGSDFDGIWANVEGLETAGHWQNLVEALKKRGFSSEEIHKIMHGNIERVFREVMDK